MVYRSTTNDKNYTCTPRYSSHLTACHYKYNFVAVLFYMMYITKTSVTRQFDLDFKEGIYLFIDGKFPSFSPGFTTNLNSSAK